MRTREQIEQHFRHALEGKNGKEQELMILEIFLDIRDLLQKP